MNVPSVVLWLRSMLAAGGVFVAAVLSGTRLLNLDLPCGDGGCEAVGASTLAAPAGISLAYVGLAFYLALFSLNALVILGIQRVRFGRWCDGMATAGAAASLVLTAYSVLVLRATCAWCLTSASISLFLFALSPWSRLEGCATDHADRFRLTLLLALPFAFATFYLCDLSASAEHVPYDPEAVLRVPVEEWSRAWMPEFGAPGTKRRLVLFGDFTCGGCRSMVRKLLSRHPEREGWVVSFRHLLPHADPDSRRAAALLETAAERGRFWETWTLASRGSGRLGDVESAMMRLSQPQDPSTEAVRRVRADLNFARTMGFRRTPTLVVLLSGHKTQVVGPGKALRLLASP